MKPMTQEIAELRALAVPELVARYTAVFGRAPRVRHHTWLWKRVAWKLQADRTGGLSKVAQRRLEELIAEIDFPSAGRPAPLPQIPAKESTLPMPGTTLVREWRGQQFHVQVLERGFEHAGVTYKSLSAVAAAVTGTHWNGKLFFGLTTPRKAKAS